MADLLSLEETADLLKISVGQVYQLFADGELTSVRRGRTAMALRSEVERRMEPD